MVFLLNQKIKIINYIKLTSSSQVSHFNFIILSYELQNRIQNFMLSGHLGCF